MGYLAGDGTTVEMDMGNMQRCTPLVELILRGFWGLSSTSLLSGLGMGVLYSPDRAGSVCHSLREWMFGGEGKMGNGTDERSEM